MKRFIALQAMFSPLAPYPTAELEWKTMTALLIGVGALVLAVIAGALLDPGPRDANGANDQTSSMDEIVFA